MPYVRARLEIFIYKVGRSSSPTTIHPCLSPSMHGSYEPTPPPRTHVPHPVAAGLQLTLLSAVKTRGLRGHSVCSDWTKVNAGVRVILQVGLPCPAR